MEDLMASIVILGLSDDPERVAYQAGARLLQKGYRDLVGVHPRAKAVLGIPVLAQLSEVKIRPHTVTVYVGPKILEGLIDELMRLQPKRIILNPGTESELLAQKARAAGIDVVEECTLVMLSLGTF
jgi:predicted CoA-binding protein